LNPLQNVKMYGCVGKITNALIIWCSWAPCGWLQFFCKQRVLGWACAFLQKFCNVRWGCFLNPKCARRAQVGREKLKPRASGVIIPFFSFFELLSGIISSQPS